MDLLALGKASAMLLKIKGMRRYSSHSVADAEKGGPFSRRHWFCGSLMRWLGSRVWPPETEEPSHFSPSSLLGSAELRGSCYNLRLVSREAIKKGRKLLASLFGLLLSPSSFLSNSWKSVEHKGLCNINSCHTVDERRGLEQSKLLPTWL